MTKTVYQSEPLKDGGYKTSKMAIRLMEKFNYVRGILVHALI